MSRRQNLDKNAKRVWVKSNSSFKISLMGRGGGQVVSERDYFYCDHPCSNPVET